MPGGGERAGLGLAVADDARDDEVGVVERRAVGVRQAIAELAPLVDRARRLRRDMRADVPGEGELLEELLHPLVVLALIRIDLRVRAFEIGGTKHARGAVTRTGHEDHVQVVALDHAIEMRPHERERRARAPVAKQAVLHVVGLQGLLEQRVVLEIDHSDGEVVARAPPGVDQAQLLARKGVLRQGVRIDCLHGALLHLATRRPRGLPWAAARYAGSARSQSRPAGPAPMDSSARFSSLTGPVRPGRP